MKSSDEGDLSDTEIFVITVSNSDRSPVIATVNDLSVNENAAMSQINADDTSGGDTDGGRDSLTYSCLFDTTVSTQSSQALIVPLYLELQALTRNRYTRLDSKLLFCRKL